MWPIFLFPQRGGEQDGRSCSGNKEEEVGDLYDTGSLVISYTHSLAQTPLISGLGHTLAHEFLKH